MASCRLLIKSIQSSPRLTAASSAATAAAATTSGRPFSSRTSASPKRDTLSDSPGTNRLPNPQDFVKVRLEPGEWDPDNKDPIHRPAWRNSAEIIHPDDWAMRSRVAMGNGELESIHDSMATLGWLNAKQQDVIYQSYLDMTQRMTASTNGVTSHEYIFRVLAQKFNLSSTRISAICVLKHNEEQMKARGEIIYTDHQDFVDEKIAGYIQAAYSAYNEVNPHRFVEPSIGNPSPEAFDASYFPTDDLLDVDGILEEVNIRDREKARLAIDTHIYKEDVDEDTIPVHVAPIVQKLLKQHAKSLSYDHAQRPGDLKPEPGSGAEPRRPRYKYACHFEDVAKKEKGARKYKGRKRQDPKVTDHTIVELDGQLRVATLKEAKGCAWKPKYDGKTALYQTLHDAWLDRQSTGSMKVWGRQEAPPEAEVAVEAGAEDAEEASGEEGSDERDDVAATEDDDAPQKDDATKAKDSEDKKE